MVLGPGGLPARARPHLGALVALRVRRRRDPRRRTGWASWPSRSTVGPDGTPVATCNGAPARAEVWHGLVFCNADLDARSFAGAPTRRSRSSAASIRSRSATARRSSPAAAPVSANWKIWVENASECYHCPTIHKHSFSDAYEVAHGVYEYRNDGPVLCQLTPPNEKAKRFGLAGAEYRYWYLFPSTFLQMDDFYTSAGRVHPTGVESCYTDGDSWLQPGLDPKVVAEWDEMWRMTMLEDIDAVAIQQPNLRSGLVPHGRLMPSSESAIAHFHRLCFEALRPTDQPTHLA